MPISIKVLACNGKCGSCYENTIRENYSVKYDFKAIRKTLKLHLEAESSLPENKRSNTPVLHGGEPLLLPIKDIESLLRLIKKYKGHTNIQTNGLLLTREHIKLFKKYKTSIGVSIDGHTPELNRGRWNNGNIDPAEIEAGTITVLENIKILKDAGLSVSVISVLRSYNAGTNSSLKKFIEFLNYLRSLGVYHIRTNPGIVFNEDLKYEELSPKRLGDVFVGLFEYTIQNPDFMIRPFRDIIDMFFGINRGSCNFQECDPYRTNAERPVMENGELSNCLKPAGAIDGLATNRADEYGSERYQVLLKIPEGEGGCRDCKYWFICTGGCPGEGVDNDWRNRTRFCESYKILFSHIEKKFRGILPNLHFGFETGFGASPLQSINKSTWLDRKPLPERPLISATGRQGVNISHGDGYADSNRPWTLKDPKNNKARPVKK